MPNIDASEAEIINPTTQSFDGGVSAILHTDSVMSWYVVFPRTNGARSPGRSTVLSKEFVTAIAIANTESTEKQEYVDCN
jgi:hypothetical protein